MDGQAQFANIKPYVSSSDAPRWVPEEHQERLAAYAKYEQIYWNNNEAFKLMRRGAELHPIYVPNAMTICDETSHYLMKGLNFDVKEETKTKLLDPFLKRAKFLSKFHINKHAGVARGDYVFHMVADEHEEEGQRINIYTVDPARFFPVYDDDDLDLCNKVHLAETFVDNDRRVRIRKLTYERIKVNGKWRIVTEEGIYENDQGKWAGEDPPLRRLVTPAKLLPEGITQIPVYHFKNRDWQGDTFGSSEIRGYERIMAGVNQAISDNELALALEGLGVYATDAGSPLDANGKPTNWEISPGRVMEIPAGASFKRVEGLGDVTPVMDHLKYLETKMFEGSATARLAELDAQVAQSGIALTVHFLPTLAKLEQRDVAGIDEVNALFEQWRTWMDVFEGESIADEFIVELGDKLPINRVEFITELNNMLDREVISRAEYRRQLTQKLQYHFPTDEEMMGEIEDELEQLAQFAISGTLPEPTVDANGDPISPTTGGKLDNVDPKKPSKAGSTLPRQNHSNNKNRTNESHGTEPRQTGSKQQGVRSR
jgi:hypothetical protein